MNDFHQVTRQFLIDYVKDNNLREEQNCMHYLYYDNLGELKARAMHGICDMTYEVLDAPNIETINFVANLLF